MPFCWAYFWKVRNLVLSSLICSFKPSFSCSRLVMSSDSTSLSSSKLCTSVSFFSRQSVAYFLFLRVRLRCLSFSMISLVLLQVVHLRVLLLTAISCIFPVFESSSALLEFLDDFFAESPFLQLPVEVFDVERRQLIIRHHVTVLPTLRINEAESWVHLFLW